MSRVCCLIFLALLAGCYSVSQPDQKGELLGVWVSNKALTLESMEASGAHSPDGLEKSFGEMAYVVQAERITFTPVGTENTQDRWYQWRVVESQLEYAVLEVSGQGKAPTQIRFTKARGCLGLRPVGQPFTEYFCKE